MPRSRRGRRGVGAPDFAGRDDLGDVAAIEDSQAEDENRLARVAVFERTKMCKFHILGMCAKGNSCRFAHERQELQGLPDLAKTKICKTLIETGRCDNEGCRYAHNPEELRAMPDAPETASAPRPHAARQDSCPVPNTSRGSTSAPRAEPFRKDAAAPPTAPNGTFPMQQLDKATFDSLMNAQILQITQAAQRHAAEAMRCQVMAAQLQAASATPGTQMPAMPSQAQAADAARLQLMAMAANQLQAASAPTAASPPNPMMFQGIDAASWAAMQQMLLQNLVSNANANASRGMNAVSGGSNMNHTAQVHPQPAATNHASRGFVDNNRGASNAADNAAAWDTSITSVPADQPVQINMRSLSSNSLQALAGEEAVSTPSPRGGHPSDLLAQTNTSSQSRIGRGSPGNLVVAQPAADRRSQETLPSKLSAPTVPCSSGEPACNETAIPLSGGTGSTTGSIESSEVRAGTSNRQSLDSVPEARERLLSGRMCNAMGMTVKNTFLDFDGDEGPKTGLARRVQTAGGRLDLMGEVYDEED